MVNVNSIERDKQQIIKNFNPEEMEAYLKSLVNLYYESFLTQDKEKHLAVTKLIEEAVKIYEAEGYNNTSYNRLVYEVNKANELLRETLIEKEEIAKAGKYLLAEMYSNKIDKVIHENAILKTLIKGYEKTPSEELASTIKDVAFISESNLIGIKYTLELEEEKLNEEYPFLEDIEILKEFYSEFLELQKKINSF